MSIYSDKLANVQAVINCRNAHVQVVINYGNIDAPMCTREDGFAYISGAPSIDDVMSYNLHTTQ